MKKDIDPRFRKRASLNNDIETKEGMESFVISLKDVIQTELGECVEDPTKGTVIYSNYLTGSVSFLNSMIIKDKIYDAIYNNIEDIIIDEEDIEVIADANNRQYLVYVFVQDEEGEDVTLKFAIETRR